MLTDDNAVKQSIKNLLLTKFFERPFQPELGSNLSALLFEPMGFATEIELEKEIRKTITNFEPRGEVVTLDIISSPDENEYKINIIFKIKNDPEPITISLLVQRTR